MERVVAPAWDQMVYLVSPILIFMSSSFSPTLQNNNYFLLLLNILMQTDLPFTDQVLSLLQTHRMAGMSLFYFPFSAMNSTWRQQTQNPSQESKLFHIIFGNTLKSFSTGNPAHHQFTLWASD